MSISPIAQAIAELSKLFNKVISGSKGRKTTAALVNGRRGLNRALKVHPELLEDRQFMKYYDKFYKYVTKN